MVHRRVLAPGLWAGQWGGTLESHWEVGAILPSPASVETQCRLLEGGGREQML